ncbi:MAG: hypothetical protein ACE15B_16260 [Bryobacteraceae bacterium]
MKKLIPAFVVLALGVASAETYRITLFQPSVVQGKELKAGDYKLDVKDNKVVIGSGKSAVEASVKVESASEKFSSTSVRYATAEGKYAVQEIRLGGTNKKLVFQP